ncbi:hypothetical protein [Promicromonospora sukumoe]
MTKWLADLFIGIGEALLTEQARSERGGVVIHAETVHITQDSQAAHLDTPDIKPRGFTRLIKR